MLLSLFVVATLAPFFLHATVNFFILSQSRGKPNQSGIIYWAGWPRLHRANQNWVWDDIIDGKWNHKYFYKERQKNKWKREVFLIPPDIFVKDINHFHLILWSHFLPYLSGKSHALPTMLLNINHFREHWIAVSELDNPPCMPIRKNPEYYLTSFQTNCASSYLGVLRFFLFLWNKPETI